MPAQAARYYQAPSLQPLNQVVNSYDQPQSSNSGYFPMQQPVALNIVGIGATTMEPSNDCVICMGVFACLCCSSSIAVIAITLALVARVFRSDTANAVSAVMLNRYAFRCAGTAIIIGVVFYVFICILYFSLIASTVIALKDMLRSQYRSN